MSRPLAGEEWMLESELFTLLDHTADAAFSVTPSGEICSWNAAAEALFGYPAAEALHRNVEEMLQARDALRTGPLARGTAAGAKMFSCSEAGRRAGWKRRL